jgi:hypothetical protein
MPIKYGFGSLFFLLAYRTARKLLTICLCSGVSTIFGNLFQDREGFKFSFGFILPSIVSSDFVTAVE